MTDPRILLLADPEPDYVADGLFHGLRSLLGSSVVDFPRRDAMYQGVEASTLYGRGFGMYGLLADIPVDREDVFSQEWDLVISAVMWRDWDWWSRAWNAFGPSVRHAAVDGGDMPWVYPYGPPWWRPRRWFVTRTRRRATYFKREWGTISMICAARPLALEPIAIAYPEEKMSTTIPHKSQQFGSHIVDLEVGARVGRPLDHNRQYVFTDEAAYLADLRASRYGVTTKRAGWDAQRHLEIAGAGAVPCFRNLDRKPDTCAPHGLVPGRNCVSYRDADDLLRQIDSIDESRREALAEQALAWAHDNSTTERARAFLGRAL